jgi:hypothetical protein
MSVAAWNLTHDRSSRLVFTCGSFLRLLSYLRLSEFRMRRPSEQCRLRQRATNGSA